MSFTSTSNWALFRAITICNLKEKSITKLEKMTKKLILGPILALFAQILTPNFFLWVLLLLDVRPCRKLLMYSISKKAYNLNSGNGEKLRFGPDLVRWVQIRATKMFL